MSTYMSIFKEVKVRHTAFKVPNQLSNGMACEINYIRRTLLINFTIGVTTCIRLVLLDASISCFHTCCRAVKTLEVSAMLNK